MPAKTGVSHGASAFVTLLVGTTMSKFLWDLLPGFSEVSVAAFRTVHRTTGAELPASPQLVGGVVVMVLLSFVWGVLYHVGRHA